MSRALVLFPLVGVLAVAGCSNNPAADYSVRDDNGDVVATAKAVPAGTTIEECVDPLGVYVGEAYCPDQDGDLAFAVNSADPFNGTAPTCLCLSAGDPGTGWVSVTTTAELVYDCAPADPLVGPAATTAYVDSDDDGLGTGAASMQCGVGEGTGYAGVDGDCNDVDPLVGAASVVAYTDGDEDGFGAGSSSLVCELGSGQADNADDCDDGNPAVFPGAVEMCNDLDDNCDGDIDDSTSLDAQEWYPDADADTYGDVSYSGFGCDAPPGYVADNTDCDDTKSDVYPGAVEVCDGVDNNCVDAIDEGGVCEDPDPDADGDGYNASVDCDDGNAAVSPAAIEVCDGVDNNCSGVVDEGVMVPFFQDGDSDGYGDAAVSTPACSASAGWVEDFSDCNDGDALVHPGASEISFNGVDDNCDGAANATASATITVTPNADQAGVSWELWLRDGTVDPTGSSTATWASGGAASGTGPLTGTVTVTNGNVEFINGPMMGYVYWAFQTTGVNVSTTISVNGFPFEVINTCWDGGGCPGTDGRWTVNTQ